MELWPLPLLRPSLRPQSQNLSNALGFFVLKPCGSKAMEVILQFPGYFYEYENGYFG